MEEQLKRLLARALPILKAWERCGDASDHHPNCSDCRAMSFQPHRPGCRVHQLVLEVEAVVESSEQGGADEV